MIGKCQSCKHSIHITNGCNIFKAQEKYIKTGKCGEFEIMGATQATMPLGYCPTPGFIREHEGDDI